MINSFIIKLINNFNRIINKKKNNKMMIIKNHNLINLN